MPLRPPAGFIRPGFDPLKNPNAPTIGTATEGNASASVAFTPPANVGGSAISAYYAVSSPGQVTVSGASSPINVTGLTNDTPYTFRVWALNTYGPGPFSAASGSVTPFAPLVGDIGLFAAGNNGSTQINSISYITITATGNATDFGDLSSTDFYQGAACGSSTRSLFAAGTDNANPIDYVNPTRPANSVFFGTLAAYGDSYRQNFSGLSNSTRGVFSGGRDAGGGAYVNSIDYVTIASTGNSVVFGALTVAANYCAAAASTTRGIIGGGGTASGRTNVIAYITIASTGNAIDFGDLASVLLAPAAASNNTRAVFGGGLNSSTYVNTIQYITIASTGNSTDFGQLSQTKASLAACSNATRVVFGGGEPNTNVMEYVTIATTGNSTDFGDLALAVRSLLSTSNCHGGL